MKSKHIKSDYIYLCRQDTFGANGNLKRLVKTDINTDTARTYFFGFIRKYWRELLGVSCQ